MNWYKEIKLAAPPLPSYRGVDDDKEVVSRSPIGIEEVERRLSKEKAKQEALAHPNLEYLGSGIYGVAYELGQDVAVKYTTDFSEFTSAKKILGMQQERGGRNLPGMVTIFYAAKIYTTGIYKIYMERVEPLSENERNAVIIFNRSRNSRIEIDDITELDFINFRKNISNYNKALLRQIPIEIAEMTFNKYKELLISLNSIGALTVDAHQNNIGKNANGDYVMLDLGGLFA